jgi:NAD-dependent dihydropyrimidine dehydrogenase PreA subunit
LNLDSEHTSAATVAIEQGQCVGCAICVDVCPSEALALGRTDLTPRQIDGRCTGCAICVRECPTGAITLLRAPLGPVTP